MVARSIFDKISQIVSRYLSLLRPHHQTLFFGGSEHHHLILKYWFLNVRLSVLVLIPLMSVGHMSS